MCDTFQPRHSLCVHSLSGPTQTHLSEFILGLGLDAEARDIRVREAGGVLQLFHPADLRHGLVLLLLLLLRLRGWHLHFMLLVWRNAGKHEWKVRMTLMKPFVARFVLGLCCSGSTRKKI